MITEPLRAVVPSRPRQMSCLRLTRRDSSRPRPEIEDLEKLRVADPSQPIEGYLNPDLSKMDDSKLSRVVVYILVALLPTLLLVPFYLSRNFVPADM